jgi:hypothetical protein
MLFYSAIYNRKCAYLSFNSTPPHDKCAMAFVPHLAVEKEEIEGVLLTPLCILQMRLAFTAAFTSEKRWMTIKKVYSAIGY